jgi:hypothetical protein
VCVGRSYDIYIQLSSQCEFKDTVISEADLEDLARDIPTTLAGARWMTTLLKISSDQNKYRWPRWFDWERKWQRHADRVMINVVAPLYVGSRDYVATREFLLAHLKRIDLNGIVLLLFCVSMMLTSYFRS